MNIRFWIYFGCCKAQMLQDASMSTMRRNRTIVWLKIKSSQPPLPPKKERKRVPNNATFKCSDPESFNLVVGI